MARHRVRPSTFGKYTSRVAKITATLGVMPARSVKAEHVARWQSELLKGGLAPGTVGDLRVALHMVMEQGVVHELIAANPVDRVAAPKVVRSSKRALVSGDARCLVEAAASDRLGAAVALLFVQGWRVSEVLGLAWEDLDLDAGVAVVRRAAVYVDKVGMVLGPTKNAGAAGTHNLSAGRSDVTWAKEVCVMCALKSPNEGGWWRRQIRDPQVMVSLVAAACLLVEAVIAKNVIDVELDFFSQLAPMWIFIAYMVSGLRDRTSEIAFIAVIILATASILVLYAV